MTDLLFSVAKITFSRNQSSPMGTKYISTNFPIRLSALKFKKYHLPRKAGFASLRLRQLRRCVSNEAYYPLAKSIKNPLAAKTLLMDLSMANAGTLIIFKLIFSQVKTKKKKWNGTVDKYPNSNELQRKQQQQLGERQENTSLF